MLTGDNATVHVGVGVGLIVTGGALGLLTVLVWWHGLAGAVAGALTSVCGATIAAGGLLVQEGANVWSWIAATLICCVLAPLHAWFVFGRPGPRDAPVVAAGPHAA